jgi:Lauroyl/myristoyl acyltransferase
VRTDLSRVRWDAGALNNGLIFGATCYGVARLPPACSYAIGHVGTWLAYRLIRRGTDAIIGNLRVVCPEADERQLRHLALSTYRSYARDTIDFIRTLDMDHAAIARMVVREQGSRLDDLLARGKGVLLVGGHFGNWEFGGIALRVITGHRITVVGKPEPSPTVGDLRRRMRDAFGIETVEVGQMLDTALRLRGLLAAGGVVAMLADRYLARDAIDVTFFGRQTRFLRSPAMVAQLSDAPLLPAFVLRQRDGRYLARFGDPILPGSAEPGESSVRSMTQQFATQLEMQIREHPEFWYQFYPYWGADAPTPPLRGERFQV